MIAYARSSDPETSHAAAASVGDLRLSHAAVLSVFEMVGDMTDEELVSIYAIVAGKHDLPAQSPSGLRSRRAELVRQGLLKFTGQKVRMSTGRMARVWGVATA